MAELGRRVRALGRLMRAVPGASITSMDEATIRRSQQRGQGHNRVTDALFGAVAAGVRLDDRSVPGTGGHAVPVRIYRPVTAGAHPPVVLNLHGGGWTLGSLDGSDWLCSTVAARAGVVVVSVDYRLAPTHRFPAAVEDSYAALEWAAAGAGSVGADGTRLAVMGDSAGGNLAAVVCLLARDRSGPRIAHQSLLYPSTDLTLSAPSFATQRDKPLLSLEEMRAFRRHYLGEQSAADPLASPLLAGDHSGLPPALIQVAEHDPLVDDGVRYARALRAAGVPVRFTEYVGMPHGFLSIPGVSRSAPQAAAEIAGELTTALRTPVTVPTAEETP